MNRKINPLPFEHSISAGVPFSSLSVFAFIMTAFHVNRSMKKNVVKKRRKKSLGSLCWVCTCRRHINCTYWAFNWNSKSPTWRSFCRCPHASPRHLQCSTVKLPEKNNLSREDCRICFCYLFKKLLNRNTDGVWDFLVPFLQLRFCCVVLKALCILQYFITLEHSVHGLIVTCMCERVPLCVSSQSRRHSVWKIAFMRKLQICHVANKWT